VKTFSSVHPLTLQRRVTSYSPRVLARTLLTSSVKRCRCPAFAGLGLSLSLPIVPYIRGPMTRRTLAP
jgi:hypothetical protein